jgi:hypothetical protein
MMRAFDSLCVLVFCVLSACGSSVSTGPPADAGPDAATLSDATNGSDALAPGGDSEAAVSDGTESGLASDTGDDAVAPDDATTSNNDSASTDVANDSSPETSESDAPRLTLPDVTSATGMVYPFVFSKIVLPRSNAQFAIDLNGDGQPDNQFGKVVDALAGYSNPQAASDDGITRGATLELIGVQTADLQNSTMAGAALQPAQSMAAPDFSGKGMFTVDAAQPAAQLFGRLSGGALRTNDPITTAHPVSTVVRVELAVGVDPVALKLNGAHVQATVSSTGLTQGELHGSVLKADFDNAMIPATAKLLTLQVQANPLSTTTFLVESIFDIGGCTNPDGSPAMAGDQRIDPCEVAQNAQIQSLFAPDVQIFSADGTTYAPNPQNAHKDSVSMGLGFTAVPASF